MNDNMNYNESNDIEVTGANSGNEEKPVEPVNNAANVSETGYGNVTNEAAHTVAYGNDFDRVNNEHGVNNGFAGENGEQRREIHINADAASETAASVHEKKKHKGSKRTGVFAAIAAACVLLSGAAAYCGTLFAGKALEIGAAGNPSVIYRTIENTDASVKNTDSTQGARGTYSEVAAKVAPTVVEIRTETVSTSSIFSQYVTKGAGSGVIITEDGYIVTNNHVISGASTVTVELSDGTEYEAKVIGGDSESDIAVIKIEKTGLVPAVVGDSTKLVVGEEVIAVGNPLGRLGGTVTNGIISALAREVTIDGTKMTLLQTNAAINPGNSGGGLFNLAGELVGVVNAKSAGSDIEGLGFAIPSVTATKVAEQIINYGYVRGRVSLGISFMDIKDSYTAMMYRVNTLGMYVLGSEYTDELKIGDRITAIDGNEVTYSSDLKALLKNYQVGDKLTLTVVRDGMYVDVELECRESTPTVESEDKNDGNSDTGRNGTYSSPFSWFGF